MSDTGKWGDRDYSITTEIRNYDYRQHDARILLKLNLPRANHPRMPEKPS